MKKTKNGIVRVALYIRVSTEEQVRHGYSLRTQEDELVRVANERGWKIVKIYRDEGNSARKPALKRPVMLELLEDVKAGKIDLIAFIKLDRWFRNVQEYHKVQEILNQHRVEWTATMEDYSTLTSEGRFKINIMLSVNEAEADRTSDRIKFINDGKVARKEAIFNTHTSPFGYTVKKIDGVKRMVYDPEQEDAAREFFALLKNFSIRLAGTKVNEKYGLKRPYTKWHKMAKDEFYTGTYKGVEDYAPAYITKEEYQKNSRPDPSMVRKTQRSRVYVFSGLIRCPQCGRRMASKYLTGQNGAEYMHYRCPNALTKACKNTISISEIKVEKQLLERVRIDLEDLVIAADVEHPTAPKKKVSQLGKLNEQLRRLNVAYFAGNMPDDEYKKEAEDLKKRIEKATLEEQTEEKPIDLTAIKELLETDFETIYTTLIPEEKQEFWRSIINIMEFEGKTLRMIEYKQ